MRFSKCPSKQLLYYFVIRDLKKSINFETGIDVACGTMEMRPYFKTKRYLGIDTNLDVLLVGSPKSHFIGSYKFKNVKAIRKSIIKGSNPDGDFVLCIQLMTAGNIKVSDTMRVVKELIWMVNPGGTLLFNISKQYLHYEKDIDFLLANNFREVKKYKYGNFLKQNTKLAPLIAGIMYLIPLLRGSIKIYYRCEERY